MQQPLAETMPSSCAEPQQRSDAHVNPLRSLELKSLFVFQPHSSQHRSDLEATLQTSSQERRHRLMQTSSEQNQPLPALPSNPITQPPPALPSNPMTQHHPTPTPFAMIPRPQSCPPTLSGWEPDDVRNVPIDIGGSLDRARIMS